MDGFGKSHIVAKNIILLGQAHLEVVDRQLDRAPFRPKLRLDGELRWAVRRPMSHKHIPMHLINIIIYKTGEEYLMDLSFFVDGCSSFPNHHSKILQLVVKTSIVVCIQ